MAMCEKREIVQPKPPVQYVLVLSEREAICLRDLLVNRSDWSTSKDGEIADINRALDQAGVIAK